MVADNMAERMVRVESKLETVGDNVKKIEGKLDKFIDTADKKYATNERVDALREHFEQVNKTQDKQIHFLESKTWKLIKDVGYILGIIAVLTKVSGAW